MSCRIGSEAQGEPDMLDLLDLPPVNDHSAAVAIAALLAAGTPIARRNLNEAMTTAFGGSDADGRWTQRDSFEMLEHAVSLHLTSRPYNVTSLADVPAASAIMQLLPTQTVRSEEQINLQQFSTPVDIAAIAVLMAAIKADDIVLEPSAGNGLLIVQGPPCASLQLNEIDAKRRERLAGIFPDAIVTGHDGAALVSLHARLPRPTVVLMNPPFSRSVGRGEDDLAALRHLQAAIRRVAKGGRVVAIMPDWFAPSARLKAAYEAVLTGCTVRTSLRLEHCYRKHGTDIAVRLYVIDKVAGSTSHTVIQRASVAEFLDAVTIPPRAALVGETTIAVLPATKPSLFGAARQAKGFFLGDGTGAGKGRQVAACILDNWLQGRRRHIWVSKNEPLLEDARRDWTALGGMSGDVQPVSNWKIDEPIRLAEGVLFVTYPTLRSMRSDSSRLKQILDWAGADFDGVIAFDEAHEMGGVAGGEGAMGKKEGSQQGVCGVLLQNNLPGARVLYASATGASDVNNLAYAVRLGLWGPETAFADREAFIAEIRKGGIAAMELVAVRRGGAIERSDDMSSG